jgi:hypothetical protein
MILDIRSRMTLANAYKPIRMNLRQHMFIPRMTHTVRHPINVILDGGIVIKTLTASLDLNVAKEISSSTFLDFLDSMIVMRYVQIMMTQ